MRPQKVIAVGEYFGSLYPTTLGSGLGNTALQQKHQQKDISRS
jgi:hypothetical protein